MTASGLVIWEFDILRVSIPAVPLPPRPLVFTSHGSGTMQDPRAAIADVLRHGGCGPVRDGWPPTGASGLPLNGSWGGEQEGEAEGGWVAVERLRGLRGLAQGLR